MNNIASRNQYEKYVMHLMPLPMCSIPGLRTESKRLFYATTGAPLIVHFSPIVLIVPKWEQLSFFVFQLSQIRVTISENESHVKSNFWTLCFTQCTITMRRTWDSFCLIGQTRDCGKLCSKKHPYCHGNFGGWRFEGEYGYMLNEVK